MSSSTHSSATPIIAILGAGITGLQTALSILTSSSSSSSSITPKPKVIILAAHLPGDEDITYTSPWAGAHWRSHAHTSPEDAEIRDWDAATYQEWRRLLETTLSAAAVGDATREASNTALKDAQSPQLQQEEIEKHVGLGIRQSLMFWTAHTDETLGGPTGTGEGLWWRSLVSGFHVLSEEELVAASQAPRGINGVEGEQQAIINKSKTSNSGNSKESSDQEAEIVFGVSYDTVCVNVPRYLSYLAERITALGGEIIRARIDVPAPAQKSTESSPGGIHAVVEEVKHLADTHLLASDHTTTPPVANNTTPYSLGTIVLATGLLSQSFLPESEAQKLYPVRGQTVLVRGEAPRAVTKLFPGGEIAYVIPRPGSGTTILGGCKEVGSWVAEEDKSVTEQILMRARALVPELLRVAEESGKSGEGEFEVLGVQIGRRPGRVGGPRIEVEKERVGGMKVLYAYGHEGAGYQNSVGSAEKVVRLLAGDF